MLFRSDILLFFHKHILTNHVTGWFRCSKTRQNNQSCTLCSNSVSLQRWDGSGCGVQCSHCKVIICSDCIKSSHVETAPRIFSDLDWACSRCYKENEECTMCESGGSLIICDGCNKDHCFSCAGLTEDMVPEGDWFCKPCSEKSLLLGSREIGRAHV